MTISSIVYAELWSGIEKSPKTVRLARQREQELFLSLLAIVDWDTSAAIEYAKIHTVLKNKGNMIGNMDLLIAAHAVNQIATLVSNNTYEFERIERLKLENRV